VAAYEEVVLAEVGVEGGEAVKVWIEGVVHEVDVEDGVVQEEDPKRSSNPIDILESSLQKGKTTYW